MDTTKADLEQLVTVLNNNTPHTYALDYMDSQPRLAQVSHADNFERYVSPRLTVRELYWWIGAYLDGWQAAQRQYATISVEDHNAHLFTKA